MVRNPLFTSGFSRVLTYFPGIVHGEIARPTSLHQEPNADDDIKCMTSRLWMPFSCSSSNVCGVFPLGRTILALSLLHGTEYAGKRGTISPLAGTFEHEVCKLGAPTHPRNGSKPRSSTCQRTKPDLRTRFSVHTPEETPPKAPKCPSA